MPEDQNPAQANRDMVCLRSFVPEDIPSMYALDQICFRNGISYSLAELELLTRPAVSFIRVAETAGQGFVGFAVAQGMKRRGQIVGRIITIDIDPAYRRRGVGRMLMKALEEDLVAHGARRCSLEVADDDLGAQKFYSGLGYQATRRLYRYYMNRVDAMVMEKIWPMRQ